MNDALREILDDFDDTDAPEGIAAELAAYREAEEVPVALEVGFQLTEPEHFDWAGRKMARAQAEVAELEEWKAAERMKLDAAFDRRIRAKARDVEFFDGMIRFAVMSLEPDAKGKRSVKTPHLVASVTKREHWEWPEDGPLVTWAIHAPVDGLVRVKESPDKTAIKAYVKATGEFPEGLVVSEVESVRLEVLS